MFRMLDLFCGVGGVARGFQKFLSENSIEFEYYAVDINQRVLRAHKLLNPNSVTIARDAYSFSNDELREFDFIWASPPCETHSKLMQVFNVSDPSKFRPPDMRLYELIERLYDLGVPFVVENVRPYYNPPIKPTSRACRHILWSNLSIPPINLPELPYFEHVKDDVQSLMDYHELNGVSKRILQTLGTVRKARDALRDMVHWRIAYRIAEQVIPKAIRGEIFQFCKLIEEV